MRAGRLPHAELGADSGTRGQGPWGLPAPRRAGTGILLLSVGDRDYKNENGELRTMPGVKNLIRYQQNIAAESGIAFWNMFEAMGGEGSMAKLVHAKPSMANYDYTHINFRGGKHLAGLLYETMIYGKEQYDRRRAYEKE